MSATTDATCECGGTCRLQNRQTNDEGPKHQLCICKQCGRVNNGL